MKTLEAFHSELGNALASVNQNKSLTARNETLAEDNQRLWAVNRDLEAKIKKLKEDLPKEAITPGLPKPPKNPPLYPERLPDQALGEWLRNPGNIELASYDWKGQVTRDVQATLHPRFCAFIEWKWGWRAMAYILLTYRYKHNLHSVWQVINRWAPPHTHDKNNVDAYAGHVAKLMGIDERQTLNFTDPSTLTELCTAMAVHEQGGREHLNLGQRSEGVQLALNDHKLVAWHPLIPRG